MSSLPGCSQTPETTWNNACRKITKQPGGVNALFIGATNVEGTITAVTNASQWESANTAGLVEALWKIKGTVGEPSETTAQLSGDEPEQVTNRQRQLDIEYYHDPYNVNAKAWVDGFNANVGSYKLAYQVGEANGTNYVRSWISGATGSAAIIEPDNTNSLVYIKIRITWTDETELNIDIMPSIDI